MTVFKKSIFFPLNGPPDAVSIIFSKSLSSSPFKHWKIAECSESTGKIFESLFLTRSRIFLPAITNVSLLANAISILFLIALIVGIRPDFPTTAVTTVSNSQYFEKSLREFSPWKISIFEFFINLLSFSTLEESHIITTFGWNLFACSASSL